MRRSAMRSPLEGSSECCEALRQPLTTGETVARLARRSSTADRNLAGVPSPVDQYPCAWPVGSRVNANPHGTEAHAVKYGPGSRTATPEHPGALRWLRETRRKCRDRGVGKRRTEIPRRNRAARTWHSKCAVRVHLRGTFDSPCSAGQKALEIVGEAGEPLPRRVTQRPMI